MEDRSFHGREDVFEVSVDIFTEKNPQLERELLCGD